jgi:hypothetical protein
MLKLVVHNGNSTFKGYRRRSHPKGIMFLSPARCWNLVLPIQNCGHDINRKIPTVIHLFKTWLERTICHTAPYGGPVLKEVTSFLSFCNVRAIRDKAKV